MIPRNLVHFASHAVCSRLLKLLELERTKANREIKRMAEDHELELARYS